jgi:hypothetical protein
MHAVRWLVPLAALLFPATASADPPAHAPPARTARVVKTVPKACAKPAVEVVAGAESVTFPLAKCDGAPAPTAVEQLSILARPGGTPKPKQSPDALTKVHGPDLAPSVRRIDPRLVERLERVVDHFRKPGQTPKVLLVSGYRPKSAGSFHQAGRALDFRVDGVTNEELVAFCKTLPDTGCGYYPNSVFIHMDVRDAGAGHIAWIDASRPGEPPQYVSSWPPPKDDGVSKPSLPLDAVKPAEDAPARRDGHAYAF